MEPLRDGCAGAAACACNAAGRGSCEAALLVRRPKREDTPLEGRRGFWREAGSCSQAAALRISAHHQGKASRLGTTGSSSVLQRSMAHGHS